MPVKALSCAFGVVLPTRRKGLGKFRRTAIIATALGASALSAVPSHSKRKQIPRSPSTGTPFRVDPTPFMEREQSDQEEHYQALVNRAASKQSMGKLQDAIADLDTAEQIQPRSDDDQARHQQCLAQLPENNPAAQHSTDAVEDLSTADALYRKAEMHMGMSNYRAALQALQTLKALDSSWDVINVLRMCSVCYNKLDQHEEALADLDKAVAMDPRDFRVLHERAVTKAALGDYEGGLADVNTAVQIRPDNANSLLKRGVILCMLDCLEAALADLDKANEFRPYHAYSLVWRGYVKFDQKDWAGAITDFNEAERYDSLDEHSLQLRAFAKKKLEMLGSADETNVSV
ncbi:hypothetical protein ABBQ38_010756 [Trebouxia sp. C0009 RCD-2024]